MPKRKKAARPARRTEAQPATAAVPALGLANGAIRRGKWAEAHAILAGAAAVYPLDIDVQSAYLNVCQRLKDGRGYLAAAQRLATLDPDDPDLAFALAGSYLVNDYPMLGVKTFREALQRWPDHRRAAAVRSEVARLEMVNDLMLTDLGLTGEDAFEIGVLHEEARRWLEMRNYAAARDSAESLLRRRPDFVPTLNNLSQILWISGDRDRAIEMAGRVLEIEPENLHALSNLTRYHLFSGRIEEARRWADRLKAIESDRTDAGTKKAEALSYLGDDRGVLDAFEAAERAGHLKLPTGDPLLLHWAAVAAYRLGETDRARRLWQRALKQAPGLTIARENQEDLRRPVGERHAPWPFAFEQWTGFSTIQRLVDQVREAVAQGRDDNETIETMVRRHLADYPETAALLPLLLDHGDPPARRFAHLLAMNAATPDLLEAFRDFALGQRGPDSLRHQALLKAKEAGLLLPGPVRFWSGGEWIDLVTYGFEIHSEPVQRHSPEVEELAGDALQALRDRQPKKAEAHLLAALALKPDAPDLLNNLAVAYSQQGRQAEAEELTERVFRDYPNYYFGQISRARILIREDKLDEAVAVLEPMMQRGRFHVSEFTAFAAAQIDLAIARTRLEEAEYWLELWEDADPDHPGLEDAEHRVALLALTQRGSRSRRRR